MKIEFRIIDNRSLKGKRKIVRSIIDKVKTRFNVSIAEVGSNDKWQKIELGVSTVANDRRFVDSSLNHVINYIDSLYIAQMVNTDIEIINI